MIKWIMLCAKLHNFVIRMKDPWTNDDNLIELDKGHNILASNQQASRCVTAVARATLLERVMENAFNFHQARGLLYFDF